MVDKQNLKNKVATIVDKLIDSAEKSGNLNFFEINIKHTQGDLSVNLINKYKEKVK